MGFEYFVIAPPDEASCIDAALKELATWLKRQGYIDKDGHDYTGLTRYGIFKDAEDLVWFEELGEVPQPVKEVVDEDIVRKINEGNWFIWWPEIAWLHKIPMRVFATLKSICQRRGCLRFYRELIQKAEEIHDQSFKQVKDDFSKFGIDVHEPHAGWE